MINVKINLRNWVSLNNTSKDYFWNKIVTEIENLSRSECAIVFIQKSLLVCFEVATTEIAEQKIFILKRLKLS
jgi:hypothetical protein